VLRNVKPVEGRPTNRFRRPFVATAQRSEVNRPQASRQDVVTCLLYPRVFREFVGHEQAYSDTACCPPRSSSSAAAWGRTHGRYQPGKTLIIKLLTIGEPHPDSRRTVFSS
jgi:pyruvate carboxylase